jgi:hypothetical protein
MFLNRKIDLSLNPRNGFGKLTGGNQLYYSNNLSGYYKIGGIE